MTKKLGLYLHVPYCAALCSYCDFAKTANHTPDVTQKYLRTLAAHTRLWLNSPLTSRLTTNRISSVFFGGGTPSLFGDELAPILKVVRPQLDVGAEVSLEANPDDLSPTKLQTWRELGVNRLSVGVQSFDARALTLLGRSHDAGLARDRIGAALDRFPNLNVDLIYGWPGQTADDWRQDLAEVLALGVPHLSLYCLTFESRTLLGRKSERGLIVPPPDDDAATFYQIACEILADAGYDHEEVSNWSKPGHSCGHNWLYWQDHHFVGVGAGAHGYLPSDDHYGVRYAYPRNDRVFGDKVSEGANEGLAAATCFGELAACLGAEVDSDRTAMSWLTELVGSGLRTTRGIAILSAVEHCGLRFVPTVSVEMALKTGTLRMDDRGVMTLKAEEWFREAAWCVEILRSCVA